MPSAHNYRTEWNPDRFIRWAGKIGEYTRELVRMVLSNKTHPEQAYKSCFGILKLAKDKQVGPVRLERAAQRALELNQYSYRFVKNTLVHHMEDTEPEEREENQYKLPFHDNIRGENYYQ